MPPRIGRARRWAGLLALPAAAGALCVLLLCGAFAGRHLVPWGLLVVTCTAAAARWGLSGARRPWHAFEEGLICGIAALALAQLAAPLQPLLYLLAAAYVLA